MKNVVIRQAQPEDAGELLIYLKRIGGETDNLTFGPEGMPFTEEEERRFIRTVARDPKSVLYVAVENGQIIGDGSLNALPRRMSHRAEVGLSVVQDCWNRGIGTALMEKLIDYAREQGVELINLEVRADNGAAIHVYEKLGFQPIGVSPAYMKVGAAYVDVLLMVLDLRVYGA